MVVQQGVQRVFFALLAGLTGSFFVRGLLSGLLYNVNFSSIIVILATSLLLGVVATMIGLLTAVRAASIEPMAVLRNE
jgi:ABC-type lipoprotein release transport system permease subunit